MDATTSRAAALALLEAVTGELLDLEESDLAAAADCLTRRAKAIRDVISALGPEWIAEEADRVTEVLRKGCRAADKLGRIKQDAALEWARAAGVAAAVRSPRDARRRSVEYSA